jgi:hypothetical protein
MMSAFSVKETTDLAAGLLVIVAIVPEEKLTKSFIA